MYIKFNVHVQTTRQYGFSRHLLKYNSFITKMYQFVTVVFSKFRTGLIEKHLNSNLPFEQAALKFYDPCPFCSFLVFDLVGRPLVC